MENLGAILVGVILVNNFVLSQFLGICPFLGVSKDLKPAVGMGISVTVVMVLSTLATWPINEFFLKGRYGYLTTVVFILIIATLVQLLETVLKKFIPSLYQSLGVYLPLIATNCAVLGVVLLNTRKNYDFFTSVVSSFGAGMGFLLAMVLFSGVRARLRDASPTKSFEGIPLTLVSASIVSLVFLGFKGII